MNKTVEAMNRAFQSDPAAIHALICNHVPCNQQLADDPFVQVDASRVLGDGIYTVSALGLLNGILCANNMPMVAAQFTEPDLGGRVHLIGFQEYSMETK